MSCTYITLLQPRPLYYLCTPQSLYNGCVYLCNVMAMQHLCSSIGMFPIHRLLQKELLTAINGPSIMLSGRGYFKQFNLASSVSLSIYLSIPYKNRHIKISNVQHNIQTLTKEYSSLSSTESLLQSSDITTFLPSIVRD